MSRPSEWRVESEDRLRRHVGAAAPITREKVKPALDIDLRRFIEASPYVCVGTVDREGRCDVSPRGDEPGFVRILDDHTLVVPERPGNRLADTLTNLLETPAIGMLFLVPGSPESLRVNGTAEIHDGPPDLLESMAAAIGCPSAIVVHITDAYMHCGAPAPLAHLGPVDGVDQPSPRPHPHQHVRTLPNGRARTSSTPTTTTSSEATSRSGRGSGSTARPATKSLTHAVAGPKRASYARSSPGPASFAGSVAPLRPARLRAGEADRTDERDERDERAEQGELVLALRRRTPRSGTRIGDDQPTPRARAASAALDAADVERGETDEGEPEARRRRGSPSPPRCVPRRPSTRPAGGGSARTRRAPATYPTPTSNAATMVQPRRRAACRRP